MLYYLVRSSLGFIAVLLVFASVIEDAAAQNKRTKVTMTAEMRKAATIIRLIEHTSWPEGYKINQYRVAFVSDEQQLLQHLQLVTRTFKIDNKTISIKPAIIDDLNGQDFEVIYMGPNYSNALVKLAEKTRRTQTLLITTNSNDSGHTMLNFYTNSAGRLKFNINRNNIISEKMDIASNVKVWGGTEIDMAELFRESEYALSKIKTSLEAKEKQLAQIILSLESKQKHITEQQLQIDQFKQELQDKEQKIAATNEQLTQLNQESSRVEAHLKEQRLALSLQKIQNQDQKGLIDNQQKEVNALNNEIEQKRKILDVQQQRIQKQINEISQQSSTIASQQKGLLSILAALVFFISLLVYILKINRDRKQAVEEMASSKAKLVTIADIGQDLTSSLDIEEVLEHVYQNLDRVLDASVFLVGILEQDSVKIPLVVENQQKLEPLHFLLSDHSRPSVWCVKNKKEVLIFNQQDQQEYFSQIMPVCKGSLRMTTVVYQPLIIGNKVIGCLSLQSPEEHAYNEDQLALIRTLSNYIAIALSNALGFSELAEQKLTLESQNQTLIETQQQLVQAEKLASLGTLTAGVAHEINNPTNFVQVGSQNLKTDIHGLEDFLYLLAGDDTEQEILDVIHRKFVPLYQHIDIIKEGTSRISTIVKDLKVFTHHESHEKVAANIVQCLESTVSLIRPNYATISQIVEHYEPIGDVLCFPAKINQVFMNLIINANDTINEKIVNKQLNTMGTIKIHCYEQDDNVVIKIADNGCGMTEETQRRLFEPFYTTKEVGEGTGLGLSISYSIVMDHNGSLSVQSTLGEGSEFTLLLPLCK